ncbi:MAG TPA: hypothetical protein EYQ74_06555 [Planctomycetes bacterium]|nr:hypothetical protein [Planctomycetota bacterium]HIK61632.1 hypothetical protein [Planctomycetota bacterium]
MKNTVKLLALLSLCSSPALGQKPLSEGGLDRADDRHETLSEMLEASRFSYQAIGNEGTPQAFTNKVSSNLFLMTGLDLPASPSTPDGKVLFHDADDSSTLLYVDTRSGSVAFSKGTKDISGTHDTPSLPTTEEAPVIATDLLKELQLAPADTTEMVVEHVGGLRMGVLNPDGSTDQFEKLRTVRLSRVLDGTKVEGPGSRIVIQLGEHGELRGLVHRWRELTPTALLPVEKFTPRELRRMISFRIAQATAKATKVEFESAKLVHYDDGQGTVEPVIHVIVQQTLVSKSRNEKGELIEHVLKNPVDFYVPILRKSKARLPFVKDQLVKGLAKPGKDRKGDALPETPLAGDDD